MLVLSVSWRTKYLRRLIDPHRFQYLLGRTIRFLRKLSAISPTCERDCYLLEKIQPVLFGTSSSMLDIPHKELNPVRTI